MYNDREVISIVCAAGSGTRMGKSIPKQFLKMGGTTILEKTVANFAACPWVDQIVVVLAGEYCKEWLDILTNSFSQATASKITVIPGGATRQASIYNAVKAIDEQVAGKDKGAPMVKEEPMAKDDPIVLVHDGVRPYCSQDLIERTIKATFEKHAVIAAVPSKDSIRHIEEGILDRSKLYNVQTPQGFDFGLLKMAYDKARKDEFVGTDDSSLVERLGKKVHLVEGEYTNIKITTPEDLKLENRIGTGFDVHKLVEGRKLILGGVEIPYEKGLDGHSDADVAVHALMDALLGAACMGDIGKLFPDTDKSFKDISSLKLLEEVARRLDAEGYSIVNADITIICQKPKLAPHIEEMRKNICRTLELDLSRLNIKATTTEKLGYTGRGEGIASEAVALLTINQ